MPIATLYGSPLSLYTGRARSYLIKNGISYREIPAQSDDFATRILPKAGGLRTIPTLETAEGEVIRDGAAIIDHYESIAGNPCTPQTPKQQIISSLFDVIGAEGLLRPAMHYRWNFPDQNQEFVMYGFRNLFPPGPKQSSRAEKAVAAMRQACAAFGVSDDNHEFIETTYTAFLDALDVHLDNYPYLLGGRPCIGDFGLLAPMFAHLGRDPAPLALMQSRAPRVYRWVERMNRIDDDTGEFESQAAGFLPDDEVPDTLINVLKHAAVDFVPETEAAASCINQWIDDQANLDAGTPIQRGVGFGAFRVGNQPLNALAQPYRFYLLARLQNQYDAMNEENRAALDDLLSQCGMVTVLDMRLNRSIGRQGNLEIWT